MKTLTKRLMWAAWAIVPVAAIGVHAGIGQERLAEERAAALLRQAIAAENDEAWEDAAKAYADAAALLKDEPSRRDDRRAITLAQAKARMMAGEYVEGQEQLDALLREVTAGTQPDEAMETRVRSEVARAAYYAAWAMRLEGATEEEWLPESEVARQEYRLLSETNAVVEGEGGADGEDWNTNLEAVIRFQRMTIDELQAMGLPKECKNCKNMGNSKKKQRQSQSKKPGQPKDDRKEVKDAGADSRRGTGW